MIDIKCKIKKKYILNLTNILIHNSVMSMIDLIHMPFIGKTECKT